MADFPTLEAIRGAMDVAKVALRVVGPTMSREEARAMLMQLLSVIEAGMPPDLQSQDVRVRNAKLALTRLGDA